jgi:hypothetical protein
MSTHPLGSAQLLDYALGELPMDEADALEAHLFDCEPCGARAAGVEGLVRGTSALVRGGLLNVMLTRSLLERLERSGLRVRRYDVPPGGTVACGASPLDELVVLVLQLPPLSAQEREGLATEWVDPGAPGNGLIERTDEVPTDGHAVYLAAPGPFVRELPPNRTRVRLLSEERELCGWNLDHQGLLP